MISSLAKYGEKNKDLEHKLNRQEEKHQNEITTLNRRYAGRIKDLENKFEEQTKKINNLEQRQGKCMLKVKYLSRKHDEDMKAIQNTIRILQYQHVKDFKELERKQAEGK